MEAVRRFGVLRDCTCKRARHQHGTREAYQNDKCSCAPCRAAWSRYIKQWKYRTGGAGAKKNVMIPSGEYVGKLHQLFAIGYSQRSLAAEMGISRRTLKSYLNGTRVFPKTAELIDKTYDRLCMSPPAASKSSLQARARAARMGWRSALAYEDGVLVDDGKDTFDHDWGNEYDFLLSCGESEEQALKRLGRTRAALERMQDRRARAERTAA